MSAVAKQKWTHLDETDWNSERARLASWIEKIGHVMTDEDFEIVDTLTEHVGKFIADAKSTGVETRTRSNAKYILYVAEYFQIPKVPTGWNFYVQMDPWFAVTVDGKPCAIKIQICASKNEASVMVHDPNGWFKPIANKDMKASFQGDDTGSAIDQALEFIKTTYFPSIGGESA